MPRINWSAIPFEAPAFEHFDFEDSNAGPISFDIRRLLPTEIDAANEKAAELIARYVTGGFHNALGQWCEKPLAYPMVAGYQPSLTKTSLRVMARLEAMQAPGDGRHTIDDLVHMSVLAPTTYGQIEMLALAIQGGLLVKEKGEGKEPGDPSALPSTE